MIAEAKRLRAMLKAEPRRKVKHPGLAEHWNALSGRRQGVLR